MISRLWMTSLMYNFPRGWTVRSAAADGRGGSSLATVFLNVVPVNDSPVAPRTAKSEPRSSTSSRRRVLPRPASPWRTTDPRRPALAASSASTRQFY